jgi:hypothetical protein
MSRCFVLLFVFASLDNPFHLCCTDKMMVEVLDLLHENSKLLGTRMDFGLRV